MPNTLLSCQFELPPHYRPSDILRFHQRDSEMLSERVEGEALHKGILWQGLPACLSLQFGKSTARATLAVDGHAVAPDQEKFSGMVQRMLGLQQPVDEFIKRFRKHAHLGPLLKFNPGLRVPVTTTPFEALTWAITGQQISVHAAVSVRRKLIMKTGIQHSSGLLCYPEALELSQLSESDFRAASFSQAKTHTLMELSAQVAQGLLPLDEWLHTLPVDDMRTQLMKVRGIGPWTINYALLRGYAHLDGSLHGDVAVRRKLQQLLNKPDALSESFTQQWLNEFSPYRALVAAHLWAMP